MSTEKQYKGYTLEEIFWWVKRLGENFVMRVEAAKYRLIFSHKSCGTQELYGELRTVAQNALDALLPAINKADHLSVEAFAEAFPESESA